MKSTLFALLLSLAFQGSASAQLQITYLDELPVGYWRHATTTDVDGNQDILFAYDGPCSASGEWPGPFEAIALRITNLGPNIVIVSYTMSLVCGGSSFDYSEPFIDHPTLNGQIVADWIDLGRPGIWSGTVTIPAGFDSEFCGFYQMQGSIGTTCVLGVDTDSDGVDDCVDNCPDDPNKTDPGACGCGNEDTDTDGDGTADCVDNCPDDEGKTEPGFCGCGTVDTNVNGDVDCDGDYDIDDAIAAMADFDLGQDDCPADVDGDGSIGFSDVLIILNDWGACP